MGPSGKASLGTGPVQNKRERKRTSIRLKAGHPDPAGISPRVPGLGNGVSVCGVGVKVLSREAGTPHENSRPRLLCPCRAKPGSRVPRNRLSLGPLTPLLRELQVLPLLPPAWWGLWSGHDRLMAG